jgi:hypothetical protein
VRQPREEARLPSSFRDPAGFVFEEDGRLLRRVHPSYRDEFDTLMRSGLYAALTDAGLLVRHTTVTAWNDDGGTTGATIEPERVGFVSYPSEWCFSQLRAAALCTLRIQRIALDHGMSLKDATAFNILFQNTTPVFIDTLSFATYRDGEPWVAYRQFCEHFLAPLLLMSQVDARLNQLSRVFIDGIPLQTASRMLPWRSRFNLPSLMHLHFHAWGQARSGARGKSASKARVSRLGLVALVDNLESAIRRLKPSTRGSVWLNYYDDNTYSTAAIADKAAIVDEYLGRLAPQRVWDLGANDGRFSRLASARGAFTVAFDADAGTVDKNYRDCVAHNIAGMLPLVMDLTNPTPSLGWASRERQSLIDRGPVDAVLALALMHHLAVSNNVPLDLIAEFFRALSHSAIVEYVPPDDPQVRRLLEHRGGGTASYTLDEFEAAFAKRYRIADRRPVGDTGRSIYLLSGA